MTAAYCSGVNIAPDANSCKACAEWTAGRVALIARIKSSRQPARPHRSFRRDRSPPQLDRRNDDRRGNNSSRRRLELAVCFSAGRVSEPSDSQPRLACSEQFAGLRESCKVAMCIRRVNPARLLHVDTASALRPAGETFDSFCFAHVSPMLQQHR